MSTSSFPLLRSVELRTLESSHSHATPPLMERAGRTAADFALRLVGDNPAPLLIFAGPGNNGGDAFVLARILNQAGRRVHIVFHGNAEKLPPDARRAYEICRSTNAEFFTEPPASHYSLVVDGLFGIGLARPLDGVYAAWIERINRFAGPVLALDVPSGLDADTGRVLGCAVRATHTISFIAAKPGLYTLDGPDHCGVIVIDALGLPLPECTGALLSHADFAELLAPRPRNSHKGSFGSLAVIGGACGMTGAALLAGRAALKLGAGRVFVGLLEPLAVDFLQPELMLRAPQEALEHASAAVMGPGLGQSAAALELLRRVASAEFPVLFDADALNLLAAHPVLAHRVARRAAPTLLTPHPAEAARLLATTVDKVQADRPAAALNLAQRFHAPVALKGCGTLLAYPDGRWRINTTGNPGLASAGTGDALAGMTGALLAQGWPAHAALACAVHLHGAAADAQIAAGRGPVGLAAGELIDPARKLFNHWLAARA
ncbi:MAG: NAD(P)H-hydrate dehydratase [Rugosibacter sp.]|nr:NAD(P)H-hydrate dehydratase [Rugosibacter sp.]